MKENKCPKCGDDYGFYVLSRVFGYATFIYKWNGKPGDSTDAHDGVKYRDGKIKRCCNCHSIIRDKK
jgi:hypothetical protein